MIEDGDEEREGGSVVCLFFFFFNLFVEKDMEVVGIVSSHFCPPVQTSLSGSCAPFLPVLRRKANVSSQKQFRNTPFCRLE